MTDTISARLTDRIEDMIRSGEMPDTLLQESKYHIDAQAATIKALVDLLETPVRSDDGLYDYNQTDVDAALAAAKKTT